MAVTAATASTRDYSERARRISSSRLRPQSHNRRLRGASAQDRQQDNEDRVTSNEQLIAAIGDPMVRELAARGQVRMFPKNTVIINEGDRGDSLFVILSGRVKVYVSDDDGREMILDIYNPGDYVGEMSLDGRPRSASVMTLEPATCSVVTRETLREAIARNPDVAMALISTLIDRARIATDNVKNLALMDVYGRV